MLLYLCKMLIRPPCSALAWSSKWIRNSKSQRLPDKGRGRIPSPTHSYGRDCHLISIFKVATKEHAPLDSDLIEPYPIVITGPVEIDDTISSRDENWSLPRQAVFPHCRKLHMTIVCDVCRNAGNHLFGFHGGYDAK